MTYLHAKLFGKVEVGDAQRRPLQLKSGKAQELLCYLFIFRKRHHARETLADTFWQEAAGSASRRYLSRTLWQLQQSLPAVDVQQQTPLLLIEPDWIQLNPNVPIWLDAQIVEEAYNLVKRNTGEPISKETAQRLHDAVEIYQGDLLAGWYQEWCLFERERMQHIYLTLLDKLMGYCESARQFERGIAYGQRSLRVDNARELTHRRLMRLRFLSGDRSGALNQYQLCVDALEQQLQVAPTAGTIAVYEQIQSGMLAGNSVRPLAPGSSLRALLGELKQLQADINQVEQRLAEKIELMTRMVEE